MKRLVLFSVFAMFMISNCFADVKYIEKPDIKYYQAQNYRKIEKYSLIIGTLIAAALGGTWAYKNHEHHKH
ncbi:MAG: hypothetical protein HZB76_02070 [Chlamydiae bacterium]|nr:hypothetical protein [Chlamydiota bacterium]